MTTCRGCGPSPDPEQDREHNDWCPDNPRRDLATTEQVIRGLRAENARLWDENERLRAEAMRAKNDPAYEACAECGRVDIDAFMCWRVGHLPKDTP